jgi:hypothetical protein
VHGEVSSRIQSAAGPVVNISESGALIEVTAHLRPGTVYVLRLATAAGRQLTLRGRVVRSQVHAFGPAGGGEGPMTYHVALAFMELSEADRQAIAEHLMLGGPAAGPEIEEDFER